MERKMIDVVKGIMEKYRSNIKEIQYKYSKPKILMNLEEAIQRNEKDLQKLNEKLKDNKKAQNNDQIKEYIKTIEEKILVLIQKKDNYEKENEFNVQEKIDRDRQKIKELGENETNTRKQLKEAKEEGKEFLNTIEKDMQKTLIEMQRIKQSIEERENKENNKKDDNKSNTIKFEELKKLYIKLRESKQDIESAIKYCEDSLEYFKEKDNKKIEEMNEFLKENKLKQHKEEAKPKGEKEGAKAEGKKEEAKPKDEKEGAKAEGEKEEAKPKGEKEGAKPKGEKEGTKPKGEKEGAKPEDKKEEAKPKGEKEGAKAGGEKEGTKPKGEKEGAKPEDKKEEAKPKGEKEGAKVEGEKEGAKPEDKKEEAKPKGEKEGAKAGGEKEGAKPKGEKEGAKPKQQIHKTKIIMDIYANKIKIDGKEDLFYKEEEKRKKELMEKYNIKSLLKYQTIKKQIKNINYALISALEQIDDEKSTLVHAYIEVKAGELDPEKAKEAMKILNKYVDIDYIFDKSFGNMATKKSARMDSEFGIVSLYGINEKGIFARTWEKGKEIIKGTKNFFNKASKKLLKRKEPTKALDENSKTAEDIVNNTMKVMDETRKKEESQKNTVQNNTTQEFRKELDAGEEVKKSTEKVSKEYKEKEKEEIHKLRVGEYEEMKPGDWKGIPR